MPLGLKNSLSIQKLTTPGIVTDNLVLKHKYDAGSVVPVSDGAASFDGTDDYINCGSDSSIDIGTSALSVTFWTYLNVAETLCFIGKGPSLSTTTDGTSGWAISLYGTNSNVYFDVNTGNNPAERNVVYTDNNVVTANKWYHIAVVVPASGGAGRKIYIDGVDKTNVSQNTITDLGDASVDLWFGDVPTGGTRELNGYMCNVGMWKGRVLTQPEIKSIMNKNYAGLTDSEKTNLVSWWNLDEGITTDGSVAFALDEHTTTLTTAPNQTWAVQSGSPTVNGQEITFTAGESQQVGCTLSTGAGIYKVNMTVSDYSGSGTISLLWDGGGSSDLRTTGNGTFEWVTYLDSSPNILKDSGAAGKVTVNSIKKYDGNVGEFK